MAFEDLTSLVPVAASDGEVFNPAEDGSVKYGQLRRFLKIFGPKFDEIKGLLDAMPVMIDVDQTDADFLPLMAALVGVQFNQELPISQQREEIKGAVQWYKRKGTVVGCRIHGYRISRLQTDIVEFWKNIKTSSRQYSVSADNQGTAATVFRLPGDQTAFSYDYAWQDTLRRGAEYTSGSVVGHEAWRALDNREDTSWVADTVSPAWWAYHWHEPIVPTLIRLRSGWGLDRWKLQWFDGSNWVDAGDYRYGDTKSLTQFLIEADGNDQTIYMRYVPVSPIPAAEVYEVTGYQAVDTELAKTLEFGDTQATLSDAGGLSKDDWIEISGQGVTAYFQVKEVEGNIVTFTTPVGEPHGIPILSRVRQVSTDLKTAGTDYVLDEWQGQMRLLAGKFASGNNIFIQATSLADKGTIGVWRDFEIETDGLEPHTDWRILVESTWLGNPEIVGIEIMPEQFYGTYYRCERLGYFFTLGNDRPGCTGTIICNKPLLRETVEKLCRTMREAVPACTVPVMTAVDCHYPEYTDFPKNGEDSAKTEIWTTHTEIYDVKGEWADVFLISADDEGACGMRSGAPIQGALGYYLSLFDLSKRVIDFWQDLVTDRLLTSNIVIEGSPPITTVDGHYYISAYVRP